MLRSLFPSLTPSRNPAIFFLIALAAMVAAPVARAVVGDIYESDSTSSSIFQFTHDRAGAVVKLTYATNLPGVRGLAFDRAGDLFVGLSDSILKITPAGKRTVFASDLHGPNFLTADAAGNLYASDRDGDVLRFTPDGKQSVFVSGLKKPSGLAVDFAGNLFVADTSSNAIYKITPAGQKTTFAEGLNQPQGLAFDSFWRLYVTNAGTTSVIAFNSIGSRATVASNIAAPVGLVLDTADNLYVADTCAGTNSIQEFKTTATTGVAYATGLGCPLHLAIEPARDLLLNVSTRARVSPGEDGEMIGGFIITGNAPKTVLLRALGPSLGKSGVKDPLQDPVLELHRSDGTTTTNDNWTDDGQQAQIESTGFAPKDSRESAILATLDPAATQRCCAGNYRAIAEWLWWKLMISMRAQTRCWRTSAPARLCKAATA